MQEIHDLTSPAISWPTLHIAPDNAQTDMQLRKYKQNLCSVIYIRFVGEI